MKLAIWKQKTAQRLKTWSLARIVSTFLILGFIFGFGFEEWRESKVPIQVSFKAIREGQQKLINPLLAVDLAEGLNSEEDRTLRSKIENEIALAKSQSKIDFASVYFKGPTQGNWIGVNPDAVYYPGSLLKVPVMIAYLKMSESQSDILFKTVTYTIDEDLNLIQNIKPSKPIVSGENYSITTLIEKMIAESDNNAGVLLSSLIDQKFLNEVYTDLGLSIPPNRETQISPKSYSIFFRVLFNSTYLSRENSERALEILSSSDFNNGIVAGVPNTVTVAHKFGEYKSRTAGTDFQELHDCGLVYIPKKPYFICIMTHGKNIADLESTIANISKVVYENENK